MASREERQMELRAASMFSGGFQDEVDYIAWNPTHPDLFCASGMKDRKIVFFDTRQSRYVQSLQLKVQPAQLNYSPDGKTVLFTTSLKLLNGLTYGKQGDETKDQWHLWDKESIPASTVTFNHVGDGLVLTHSSEATIRILNYPSMTLVHATPAHVGGCVAATLDPRGRYLASGGHDSIVNLFDLSDWICTRTITACDNSINALSFSYDGEYLAIANAGSYIDICATETGIPLHRVPALGPSPTVAWHPSKYVIAYCGQTKIREGGPPPSAWISLFGPGMTM